MLAQLVDAGSHAVWLYRLSQWFEQRKARPWRWLAYLTYRLNLLCTGADIPPTVVIGKNFRVPHPVGVVIGRKAVIGDHVKIMSGVVLGSRSAHGAVSDDLYPLVGDNVFIGPNSVVLGAITIGDFSTIGACAVVTRSVEKGSVVRVSPPIVESRREDVC